MIMKLVSVIMAGLHEWERERERERERESVTSFMIMIMEGRHQ
jgi:hypothetical protein